MSFFSNMTSKANSAVYDQMVHGTIVFDLPLYIIVTVSKALCLVLYRLRSLWVSGRFLFNVIFSNITSKANSAVYDQMVHGTIVVDLSLYIIVQIKTNTFKKSWQCFSN